MKYRRNILLFARTLKGALLGLGVGIAFILPPDRGSANRRLIVVELDRCHDDALNSVAAQYVYSSPKWITDVITQLENQEGL